jgi:hypothetical protein
VGQTAQRERRLQPLAEDIAGGQDRDLQHPLARLIVDATHRATIA